MYEYFGGVAKILVPDNCKTAVIYNKGRKDQRINAIYHKLAEHYGTAIIPARVKFFTIAELNTELRKKLDAFNDRPFQKKEGSRYELFHDEELPLLTPLPATQYELAEWKQATVQFNYHTPVDGILYSIPYEYIGKKVNVRITGTFSTIKIVSPLTGAYTVVKVNIAPLRSICPRNTSIIWSGTATASVNGQKG